MKKIYDGAIKDLMKLMVPDAPKAPQAPHGVQIHIHGAAQAPGAGAADPSADPAGENGDPSAAELGLPPLGASPDKHKAEMAAMHAKKKGI